MPCSSLVTIEAKGLQGYCQLAAMQMRELWTSTNILQSGQDGSDCCMGQSFRFTMMRCHGEQRGGNWFWCISQEPAGGPTPKHEHKGVEQVGHRAHTHLYTLARFAQYLTEVSLPTTSLRGHLCPLSHTTSRASTVLIEVALVRSIVAALHKKPPEGMLSLYTPNWPYLVLTN
jgi:hypothetical protein